MKKKIVMTIIIVPAMLISLLVISFLAVINWPTLILNPTVLNKIAELSPKTGYEINWSDLETSSESHGLFDKTVFVNGTDICVISNKDTKICFKNFEASFRYKFIGIKPNLVSVGHVNLTGGNLKYQLSEKEEDTKITHIPIISLSLPGFLQSTRFHPINISINNFSITDKHQTYEGSLNIKGKTGKNNRLESVTAKLHITENDNLNATINATLNSKEHFKRNQWKLDLKGNINLPPLENTDIDLSAQTIEKNKLKYTISAKTIYHDMHPDLTMSGTVSKDQINTNLNLTIANLPGIIQKISTSDCNLSLKSTSRLKNEGSMDLACPVTFTFKQYKVSGNVKKIYAPPTQVALNVNAGLNTFFIPAIDKPTSGTVEMKLKPQHNKLVSTRGDIKIDLSGNFSDFPKNLNIGGKVDIEFIIDQFSQVIKSFNNTPLEIWAPFNVFDGKAKFTLKGNVKSLFGKSEYPLEIQLNLESKEQKINLESDGDIYLSLMRDEFVSSGIDADIEIKSIVLQLPDINPVSLPRLLPDNRIDLKRKREAERNNGTPFNYNLKIKTIEDSFIKLKTTLAKEAIPIKADMVITNDGVDGNLIVSSFPLNIFKRDATIEEIKLDLRKPTDLSEVDGTLRIDYADYTIRILLSGTVKRPQIVFRSDPPLSEENIMSVLIYGETFEELDTTQADSVGNMSAAVADRALALTSLYVLSSTPIQNVGYNPSTKTFSAKIKIAKGTSFTYGRSKDDYQHFGLQKRLGHGWLINTSVDNPTDEETMKGSAFIEWHKRY